MTVDTLVQLFIHLHIKKEVNIPRDFRFLKNSKKSFFEYEKMAQGNGNTWENWERNTEESHEYADFILKELGSITNTVSTI